jgi:hypothetical protein
MNVTVIFDEPTIFQALPKILDAVGVRAQGTGKTTDKLKLLLRAATVGADEIATVELTYIECEEILAVARIANSLSMLDDLALQRERYSGQQCAEALVEMFEKVIRDAAAGVR